MGALTPQFVMDLESNMKVITENEYTRLSASLWWPRIMKRRSSAARRELLTWLLSTATIIDFGTAGGQQKFEDLIAAIHEYEHRFAGSGFKVKRSQLEDTDGNGVDLAGRWSADIGQYMAYWPQKQLVARMKGGHVVSADFPTYDGKAFFATDHPVCPGDATKGTYSNLLTGAGYKIDDSVTVDVALANLGKIFAAVRGIKMPNGEDPRGLRAATLIVPPKMGPRAAQLTNAKVIAQAAASGGGGADVEALIQTLGFAQPIIADEFDGFESDTTFFVGVEQVASSEIGALLFSEREPFKITYYTGQGGGTGVDADLDRKNELEWHCAGRNTPVYGHPYGLFKVSPST